jgi:hypothetical protein
MTRARERHTATLLPDGRVLIAGGYDGNRDTASAEVYDPSTGTWSATGAMAQGRFVHTASSLPDGKVLVTGGAYYEVGTMSNLAIAGSAEVYDPSTGTWTVTGAMTQDRASHTATSLPDGSVLVVPGHQVGSSRLMGGSPPSALWRR